MRSALSSLGAIASALAGLVLGVQAGAQPLPVDALFCKIGCDGPASSDTCRIGLVNGSVIEPSGVTCWYFYLMTFWPRLTTNGAVASMVTGTLATLLLIWLSPTIQVDVLGRESAWFPLKNPALVTIPLAFGIGMPVSLLEPEPEAAARHRALARQMHLGHERE